MPLPVFGSAIVRLLRGIRPAKPRVSHALIGLGNVGAEYRDTRHNIGFLVIDSIARRFASVSFNSGCHSLTAVVQASSGHEVMLAKPLTLMNRSGEAVSAIIRRCAVDPGACLVIVDDFNLPLGKIRFRRQGSAGGHNGLKSIITAVGESFPRLRVGIGPLVGGSVIDFVLGRFDPAEFEARDAAAASAAEGALFFVENGIEAAMNKYNG